VEGEDEVAQELATSSPSAFAPDGTFARVTFMIEIEREDVAAGWRRCTG
jgi:hypothetical protein